MEYQEVTETIIGCAYRVYNKMGFGFLESVYQKCLLIELRKAGLDMESQEPITVYYDDEIVGEFVADIIVNDTIILELKSIIYWSDGAIRFFDFRLTIFDCLSIRNLSRIRNKLFTSIINHQSTIINCLTPTLL